MRAKKTKSIIKVVQDENGPKLSDYGLQLNEEIRYQSKNEVGSTWNSGRVKYVYPDGSIAFIDDYSGGARTMYPDRLECKVKGPRGGTKWEKVHKKTWQEALNLESSD